MKEFLQKEKKFEQNPSQFEKSSKNYSRFFKLWSVLGGWIQESQ